MHLHFVDGIRKRLWLGVGEVGGVAQGMRWARGGGYAGGSSTGRETVLTAITEDDVIANDLSSAMKVVYYG